MSAQAKIADYRPKLHTPTLANVVHAPHFYFTTVMEWNDDIAYAFTPLKLISLPLGYWPLQKNNIFDLLRYIVLVAALVRFQFLSRG